MFLLGLTGVLGVHNGITEWTQAVTWLQKSVTGGVLVYGVLGILGAIGLALRKRWSFPIAVLWGVVVTYVPAAAVMAYAPDGTWGAAIPGSVAAGLIAAAVAWSTWATTREANVTRAQTRI